MAGERARREPDGNAEKWKMKKKVWARLSKGGLAGYIDKLHGHDPNVTNLMVNSWKEGRVKIDGVHYQVDIRIIAHVSEIPDVGLQFFQDKKVSVSAVKEFAQHTDANKELVKTEMYFEMEPIKKLWRYVLKAIISYITLDTRFDRIRMHHIVLLNHFRFDIKVSLPYYLYVSINKNILGLKRKSNASPTVNEGLLLLLYEYFRALARNKKILQIEVSEDSDSSQFSSESEDLLSSNSDDELENPTSDKPKRKAKQNPSPVKSPSKKSPRINPSKNFVSTDDDYNEDSDGMESEEKSKVEEDTGGNKTKKRRVSISDNPQAKDPEPTQKVPIAKELKDEEKVTREVVTS